MPQIDCHDVVRVIRLIETDRRFDGTEGVSRPPRVGDEGTIVFAGGDDFFIVESVDANGLTIWLADFQKGELESLHGKSVDWNSIPSEVAPLIAKLRIGMSRDDVRAVLGDPEATSLEPKPKIPTIWKYGCVELYFEPDAAGGLLSARMEDAGGVGISLLE